LNPNQKCDWGTPCGVDLTVKAFKAALKGENLGRGKGTDILAVSFSSYDIAGHVHGPNSPEIHEMVLAQDRAIADLREARCGASERWFEERGVRADGRSRCSPQT